MKRIYFLVSIVALIMFTSCMSSSNYLVFERVENENKTITVQAGSDPFLLNVKRVLLENGWDIEAFKGAKITLTEGDKEIESDTFNTKYILVLNYNYGRDVFLGDFMHHYNISIVNVETRAEVLLMNGNKTRLKKFLSKFDSVLKEFSM